MNEQSLETRVTLLEERLKAMEKILTMLSPSQKVAVANPLIFESLLQLKTDPSLVIQMEALKLKPVNGSEGNEPTNPGTNP